MILFYLITLLYGSNSLPLSFFSRNQTKGKTEDNNVLAEIKTNPQGFISEVQNLDPAALKQIISLLEELREKSEARENELITDLENKASALDDADQDLLKAEDAEDKSNQAVTDAEGVLSGKQAEVTDAEGVLSGKQADAAEADQDLNDKKEIRRAKKTEKDVAQTAHDDEVPSLNEEQAVLANVIDIIQGLHDKHAGSGGSGEVAKLNFGPRELEKRNHELPKGWTSFDIGRYADNDRGGNGHWSEQFTFEGANHNIVVDGFAFSYSDSWFPAVENQYSDISNLLRTGFTTDAGPSNGYPLSYIGCTITGLKPSTLYEISTYHHSTLYPNCIFQMKYDGNPQQTLQQSSNGVRPDPPLIHVEQVTSTDNGEISFKMVYQKNGHMDLNALEIRRA